jgi:hypothetical protein
MARPQVVVNVLAALPRRGAASATGTAVLVFAGGSGVTTPVRCLKATDASSAYGPTAQAASFAASVGDALALGAPEVIAVRVAGTAAEVTEEQWAAALDQVTEDFGASAQVAIPGVSTQAAHDALLGHAAAYPSRTVFLDGAVDADADELAAIATAYDEAPAAMRAALVAPWVVFPAAANTTRLQPGSVVAAGLAARGDAIVGHTNHAPAGDQGRGAGVVTGALRPATEFTGTELDALHDAGVSVIRQVLGRPTLYGWRSLSSDERYRQLNSGRFAGQLAAGVHTVCEAFLFRQIDGRGHLFAEVDGALRGYLLPLYTAGALYGDLPGDAFDVQVAPLNTPDTIRAGELHAAIAVALTPHTERVVINVVTRIAQEA